MPSYVLSDETYPGLTAENHGPGSERMMLGCVGTDHHRAPLHLRERLTLAGDRLDALLLALRGDPAVAESAVLSTCNRMEVYVSADDVPLALEHARQHILRIARVPAPEAAHCFEARIGVEVARHLCAVASGLESLVPGEPQILPQVREAFECVPGSNLRLLARAAVSCGKRVRTETLLGRGLPDVSGIAVELAQERLGGLCGRSAVLVGAGRVNEVSAQRLGEAGIGSTVVVSRTREAAMHLAARHGGCHAPMESLPSLLTAADVVIAATRAPRPSIPLSAVSPREAARPLLLYDLGVPRDVDSAVGALPHVELVDLDALRSTLPGVDRTDESSVAAWAIVESCTEDYMRDVRVRSLVPRIAELQVRLERRRDSELSRAILSGAGDEATARLAHRLTAGAFHEFVVLLKSVA